MNRQFQWCWPILLCYLIIGCSNTPTTDTEVSLPAANVSELTPAEKKSYEQALSQLSAEKPEKAEKTLHKLAQSHPGNPGLWINLANACYQSNQLEKANTAVKHAQKLNGNTPELYNIAGLVAVANGDYKNAEKHYLTVLKLNSNAANTHYNLALLYDVFFQDIRRAVTHYEQYLALGNQDDEETTNWLEELKLNLARGNE